MSASRNTSSTGSGPRSLPADQDRDSELLMRAMVAACAYIARADGVTCATERARAEKLINALHSYVGFSAEQAMLEFNSQLSAFELNPAGARRNALDAIASLNHRPQEQKIVLSACQHVLEADGVYHPYEYEALQDIGRAITKS